MRFTRTASGQPWLQLDGASGRKVLGELTQSFGAVPIRQPEEDALGDSWVLPFRIGAFQFTLDCDCAMGLSIIGDSAESEPLLRRIEDHLRALRE